MKSGQKRKTNLTRQISKAVSFTGVISVAFVNLVPSYAAVSRYAKEDDAIITYGNPKNNTLSENLTELTQLLDEKVSKEYAAKEEKIKNLIEKRGWNYEYTIQSFYDQKSPYSDIDYAAVIAAYGTVLQYGRGDGPLFTDLELVNMKVSQEKVPDDNSNEKYGRVVFSVKSAEEILNEYGYSFQSASMKKDFDYRYQKICEETPDNSIRQGIAVLTPQSLSAENQKSYEEYAAMLPDDISEERRCIVLNALSLLGKVPYEWGGKASSGGYDPSWWTFDSSGQQKGLDCSGYVQWVYMTSGYAASVTNKLYSTASISRSLSSVSESDLQPGDIGLLNTGSGSQNHTGIYLGNGLWIHCSSGAKTVIVSNYNFKYFKKAPTENAGKADETSENTKSSEQNLIEAWTSGTDEGNASDEKQEEAASAVTVAEAAQAGETEDSPEQVSETSKPQMSGDSEQQKEQTESVAKTENAETGITEETISGGTGEGRLSDDIENKNSYSEEDVTLLAQLITHEALGEGYNGWVAVGEVVMNRVESSRFPGTVSEVIFQKGQFSGARSITSITPRQEVKAVARQILDGSLRFFNNKNVLYFCNPTLVSGVSPTANVSWNGKSWYACVAHQAFYLG